VAELRYLVVGGHTRSIGKTSLVVDLIRAFPEAAWTAVKITQYGHGVCTTHGEPCECASATHPFALDEERDRSGGTDTSRFLVAGARRSLWLRTRQGELAGGMPLLREALAGAENVILESNAVLAFIRPALYLVVLEGRLADFKETAQKYLDRADAFVLRTAVAEGAWEGVPQRLIQAKSAYYQALGDPLPGELVGLVQSRFFTSVPPQGKFPHLPC
jgi:hypothetical protein